MRHELRDALRSSRADRGRVEAALLPNEAREELLGELVVGRRLRQGAADVVDGGTRTRWFRLGRHALRSIACGTGGLAQWFGERQRQLRQADSEHHTCCREPQHQAHRRIARFVGWNGVKLSR